jgi:tetratricopeptide (TPR) repeat protein
MILFLAENDCKSALETCIKAIDTLTLRPSLPRAKMMSFALNALFCYSQLRIFNTPETLSIIETCNRLTPVGSILWFKVHEVEVQHYLYAGEYDKALDKSKAALSHPKFNALTGINADIWRVYAGYFHLLAQLGALDAGAVASVYGPIDPHFFDYEIRIFRTAKEDMNIPVMMIPIYFGALKGELEALGRSKESLEQYTKRHLLIRKNVRSAAMMRLLFALEEMAYDAKSAQKKIKKNLSAFKSTPIELNEFSSAIEIIPYDHLWQLICRYKKIEIH